MNETLFGLSCFALGFVASIVPQQVQQYMYRKHLEKLAEEEQYDLLTDDEGAPLEPEDIREKEKEEEKEIRFFG